MSENRNVTVKLKKAGWEVEITCPPEQLQKAVESVLSSLPMPSPGIIQTSNGEKGQSSTNKTCRGLIFELWEESWFEQPRSLSDVHEELARRGFHYDKTAVSHSLTDLVRENTLSRIGNMRNYSYIQKRPPGPARTQDVVSVSGFEDSTREKGEEEN